MAPKRREEKRSKERRRKEKKSDAPDDPIGTTDGTILVQRKRQRIIAPDQKNGQK
jgi:hypothetical protein